MPKQINPIRKALLKKSLMKGKSIRQSMKDAGYSERTAHGHCDQYEPVVKRCIEEINKSFRLENITPEKVLKDLELAKELALKGKLDLAAYNRANELLGKYLAMFTDKSEVTNKEEVSPVVSTEDLMKEYAEIGKRLKGNVVEAKE